MSGPETSSDPGSVRDPGSVSHPGSDRPGSFHRPGFFLGSGSSPEGASAVVLGVPLDETTSFRSGTREGPGAIRAMSHALEEYSPILDRELGGLRFYDAGDLLLPQGNLPASLRAVHTAAAGLAGQGLRLFTLGGEHLLTYPLVELLAGLHPDLAVIHLDAHADLRDTYLGEPWSHATVMRRVAERIGGENLYQLGVRSGSREELAFSRDSCRPLPGDPREAARRAAEETAGRALYVTVDIDVIDPAFAPGTGAPEPGGLSPGELFETLRAFDGARIAGFDLVEVSPPQDHSGITSLLAAKVLREAILLFGGRYHK